MNHPAKYTDVILDSISKWIPNKNYRILDPFAGTGKLRMIAQNATLVEIEYEWAKYGNGICANALHLPFPENTFDYIVTSPVYGNRMSDHHNAKDGSRRFTYFHALGHLHKDNSGMLQWGDKYRKFHEVAWTECTRVLKNGGKFILNISDHIRKGQVQRVSAWHMNWFASNGYSILDHKEVKTPRNRNGQNNQLRVDYESLVLMEKKK